MKSSLLEILLCKECGASELALEIEQENDAEIIEGKLICKKCHCNFLISHGIFRTVNTDSYVDNFSFEWQLHRKTQLDDEKDNKSEQTFVRKTGVDLNELKGQRILDVGVGTGRFADVVERAGGEVVGIDLSFAVETAMENIGFRKNVNVVQADAFHLPFRNETFDVIYSIGVLHHTPDCRKAFESLLRLLRPGGTIAIWVYDAHNWSEGSLKETVNRTWRALTTRLPSRILYGLCILELPYYFLRKIPGFEQMLHLLLPGFIYHAIPTFNNHLNVREHVLDVFDWLSPTYQSKHTYPEVFGWFEDAKLEEIHLSHHPVGISGKKPTLD